MPILMQNDKAVCGGITLASELSAVDTEGIVGTAGSNTTGQLLFDELAERSKTIIAAIDNSDTASKAYVMGEYLSHNGTIYRATKAIAQGDTFVDSDELENIRADIIADDLYDITIKIAPIEMNLFTSRAYNEGEYLWYNGKLYKVTSYLATRTNITTHAAQTTISEELQALNNSLANKVLVYDLAVSAGTNTTIASKTDSKITEDYRPSYVCRSKPSATFLSSWSIDGSTHTFSITGTCTDASQNTISVVLVRKDNT